MQSITNDTKVNETRSPLEIFEGENWDLYNQASHNSHIALNREREVIRGRIEIALINGNLNPADPLAGTFWYWLAAEFGMPKSDRLQAAMQKWYDDGGRR